METPEQRRQVENLANIYGRVHVKQFPLHVEAIVPTGGRFIISEGGTLADAGVSFSVDWKEGLE